jgi:hypothetical protein
MLRRRPTKSAAPRSRYLGEVLAWPRWVGVMPHILPIPFVPDKKDLPDALSRAGEVLIRQTPSAHEQSLCNTLGAGGPAMHGIALKYS